MSTKPEGQDLATYDEPSIAGSTLEKDSALVYSSVGKLLWSSSTERPTRDLGICRNGNSRDQPCRVPPKPPQSFKFLQSLAINLAATTVLL